MKFKEYSREYEKVFSDSKEISKKLKINNISTFNNEPESIEQYVNLFKDNFKNMYDHLFDHLVKMVWLIRRFVYDNKKRDYSGKNGINMDRAFGLFMRTVVGYDHRFFMGRWTFSNKVISYFDDFFQNFDEGNPFYENYEYPYKYMTLDCLSVVYQMDERLDILNVGERDKMTYTEFLDYVLNYINCYNEEHGEKYAFIFAKPSIPYVQNINRKV